MRQTSWCSWSGGVCKLTVFPLSRSSHQQHMALVWACFQTFIVTRNEHLCAYSFAQIKAGGDVFKCMNFVLVCRDCRILFVCVCVCVCVCVWQMPRYFIHIYIIWICVMSHVQPAILHGKSFNVGDYLHTCCAFGYHWLLPFNTTFTDFDLGLGSQGQHKQNLLASFSPTLFNFDQDEIWCGDEAIQAEHPKSTFE